MKQNYAIWSANIASLKLTKTQLYFYRNCTINYSIQCLLRVILPFSPFSCFKQNNFFSDSRFFRPQAPTPLNPPLDKGVVVMNQQKITYDREFSVVNSGGLNTWIFKEGLNLTLLAWKWSWWRIKNICSKNFHDWYFYPKLQTILRRRSARVMSILHVNSAW